MPFNLLLFPLLGGYYFVIRSNRLKYFHQRIESQKLLFHSAIAGVFFLIISLTITAVFRKHTPDFYQQVRTFLPVQFEYSGVTFLSFLLGIVSAETSNFFYKKTDSIRKAIRDNDDPMELLIMRSWETKILLCITLKSGKVYIGYTTALPIPSHTSFISILPVYSGYRDSNTKIIEFTTEYVDIYARLKEEQQIARLDDLDFQLLIPTSEVVTVNIFDLRIYDMFNTPTGS